MTENDKKKAAKSAIKTEKKTKVNARKTRNAKSEEAKKPR